MKERINKLTTILKIEYAAIWIAVAVSVVMYESDMLPQGALVGNAKAEYMIQLTGVLLAICLIPMSLRMFGMFITKHVRSMNLEDALKSYRRWSEIRMMMLFVVAVFNVSMYYLIIDITGLLCGGMALAASLFCIPGRARILSELNLDSENL